MAIYKLGEISNVISGRGPNGVKNIEAFKSEYGGVNWLLVKNLKSNQIQGEIGKYNFDPLKHKLIKLNKNEMVYSMYATPGIVAINFENNDLYINQSFCKIIPNPHIVIQKYLYFYLIKNKNNFLKFSSGTTQKNLNLSLVKKFNINIPPLEIQNSIISIIEFWVFKSGIIASKLLISFA
ncbi:restriction endonuclease subunit S [Mesomycoplasma neurolyticum]|uniref:Type I restriction-modification system, S subunit n=1 Tax=Mesomycoplasma neurolyticum TaxID=2120 RepID=A0A449A6C0_9BACT|nr:type I restriction-modification system, S subunit [Mesomycoplasma neurolyticum]VEU59909.1 type I restriction-modification system, S subunit [Mesomycoplasma neurolyticum]